MPIPLMPPPGISGTPANHLNCPTAASPLTLAADAQRDGPEADAIRDLDNNYIRAWREHDMDWYRANLSEDLVCTAGDGSVLSKRP